MESAYTPEQIRNSILGLDTEIEIEKDGKTVKIPVINLDNAATTPAFKEVADEIYKQLMFYGSIGRGAGQKSIHSSMIYEHGRDIVKQFVGATNDIYTVLYVNNTTDGMNKLASALIQDHNDIVLTTRMEHHANDLPWRERAKTIYAEVDNNGRLNVENVERIFKEYSGRIKYIAVTAASNVTGYVNDVHSIARIAHKYGARIIVDGAQIVSHRKFSMLGSSPTGDDNIDFFVFSAHKMYSPYGGGAIVGLYDLLNNHVPQFYGGGMVNTVDDNAAFYCDAPDSYEAGSPNYAGVVGMLKSIEILNKISFDYIHKHEQSLLKYTIDKLKQIPNVILYGDNDKIDDRVGIIVFNLQNMSNSDVASALASRNAIAVRNVAFCAHPYVRRLTNELDKQAEHPTGMVRISFGVYTNKDDIDHFIETIQELSLKPITKPLANNYLMASRTSLNNMNTINRAFKASKLNAVRIPNDRG